MKKISCGLLIIALTFFFTMIHINSACALGDYHYYYVNRQVKVINNNKVHCILQVGCSSYCFWDRVIKVDTDAGFASMASGPSSCEIIGYNLTAKKIDDYKAAVFGEVQVKTIHQFSRKQAKEFGLIDAGFYSNSTNYSNKYYKIIEVYQELQP